MPVADIRVLLLVPPPTLSPPQQQTLGQQEVESKFTGKIMQLEAALFNAEQLASKVSHADSSSAPKPPPLGSSPFSGNLSCPPFRLPSAHQYRALYETKAEADADKARQLREMDDEAKRTMERVVRSNNTDLKKEVRWQSHLQ